MTLSLLMLPFAFIAGMAAGVMYFRSLWWTTQRIAAGKRVLVTVLWTLARLGVLGLLLTLTVLLGGALAMLLAMLGVLAGRALVMRGLAGALK